MWRSLAALAAGYVRAIGVVLQSLWHSLGSRGSLLFSIFFTLLLTLLFFLGTEAGRVALTRGAFYGAERLLPDLKIQADEIGSEHLGDWSFAQLKIDYRSGVLLQARDLALDVDLGGLLGNRIDIERLGAADLRFDGDVLNELIAAQGGGEGEAERGAEAFSPPSLRLGSLQIDRLLVIYSRVPELPAVSVTSSGSYRWQGEPAELQLNIDELNGAGLQLALSGREFEHGRYSVEISAKENPGGFAGKYLLLPPDQQLDARARLSLWQPRANQLLLTIEEFSLPLVDHNFALGGRAAITLSPWKIASEKLLLKVDDTEHQISGSVSADSVDADIQFHRLPVSISQPWQDYLVGGWLSADLTVRGPLSLPSVSGVLDLSSSYRNQPLRLQSRVQTREQVITLQGATLEYAEARLQAEGSVDIGGESLDLRGTIQRLSLDDLRQLLAALPGTEAVEIPPELRGSVDKLQLSAKGPWNNPALSATLKANPVYRRVDADLQAELAGDLKVLRISKFQLHSEALSISGGGTVNIAGESLQLQLDLSAQDFRPAEQLELAAAEDTAINLDAAVAVDGPWKNPQLDAHIRSDGSYRDYRFDLRGGAAGDMKKIALDHLRLELYAGGGARRFDTRELRGPMSLLPKKGYSDQPLQSRSRVALLAEEAESLGRSAWLEVNGVIEPQAARAEGTIAGRNIPVSLAELAGVDLPPSLEGDISIEGNFSGPFTSPQLSINLLGLGEFRREPWQLQGDIGYRRGSVELSEVELVWAERNRLSAQGSMNSKKLDLELRGRAVLADLDTALPADIAERGEITLSASAAGSPEQPLLNGELKVTSQAQGLRNDSVQLLPLSLLLGWQTVGGQLHISLDARQGSRRAVDASGRLAVAPILQQLFAERPQGERRPPLPLRFDSSGSADLSVVAQFFDPEIHAMRGQLNFALNADGTFAAPKLNGHIKLEHGDYEYRPSNTRLRNIDFLARLTPSEWRIERAHADDGEKGDISLSGAVSLAPPAAPALNFRLRAEHLHLLNTSAVRGAVSGTLDLTGSTEDALLQGKLTLRPLSVQIEQLFGSSVPEIEVVEVEVDGPQVERAPPLLQKIALAIQVVLDKQSYVRGLGLDSQLRGTVGIAGTAAKPQASGELKIVRGNFDLLGKRFKLQKGEVQFENNAAAIYVKGVHEYSDGEITAEISGTTKDLDVTFSSTPAAAQDEIFAQLLFGKSLSDISPLQAVRLVTVVRTLQSGGSVFDPVAKTRELLRVDTLDIEQEETDEGEQYALSLGKYITNRIYIELQRSTDPLNPWEAKMQIELRRHLSVDIKSADNSESGAGSVELQWKKDY